MLKPEKMALVTIAGPKTTMEPVIRSLHSMKVLHIEDGALGASKTEGFDIGAPIPGSSEVSETIIRARSLLSRLCTGRQKRAYKVENLDKISVANKKIAGIEEKLLDLTEKVKKIDDGISRISSYKSELEPLAQIDIDVSSYAEYRTIAVFAGFVSTAEGLKERISASARNFEIHSAEFNRKPVVAVFCDINSRDAVRRILTDAGFSEISTKNVQALHGKPTKLLDNINSKIAELEAEKSRTQKNIAHLSEECAAYLLAHTEHFEAEAERLEAPLKFAASKNAFVATGWIPEKTYAEFETKIRNAADGRIFITKAEAKEMEDAPVSLSNPRAVKHYEFFLDLYSLPKYTEIDPTFFMFLTFPFFFGFMVGDAGYGLLTLIIFTLLKAKMPAARNILTVMIFSSISAIIFGLAYGEFFGLEEIGHYEFPHILNRVSESNSLFMAAIAVGAVHVNIGLLAGFYNVLRMHGLKHALFEKASWIVIEAGAAIAALPVLGYNFTSQSNGFAIMAIGILMLLKGEGVKGILELPSIVANILSYARLMAVGLVSVILAVVVNENAKELFHAGPLGVIAAVIILVAGHGINIALGLLSPFIHSMRLHYVEFFLKFYHGGGKRYMPFGSKKAE